MKIFRTKVSIIKNTKPWWSVEKSSWQQIWRIFVYTQLCL